MRKNFKKRFEGAINIVMAVMMATMAIFVFLNVILRYGFNSGISGTEDVSRLMFVWVSFLGAVAAMSKRGHLSVDMVLRRLSGRPKRVVGLLGRLLMLAALVIMFIGCWQQMVLNNDTLSTGSIAYPMSWPYAAGVFASAACIVYVLADVVRLFRGDTRCLDTHHDEDTA